MKYAILGTALVLAGTSLSTDYAERTFQIDVTTNIQMETTSFSMEMNGEPMEGRGGGGDRSSTVARHVSYTDVVREHSEGSPTLVHRTFDELEGSTSSQSGDRSNESASEVPLMGGTIEIQDSDGTIEVELIDGDEVDDKQLEGHLPTLPMEALLPDGDVDVGDSWDLDGEAILQALGFDVASALYPAPPREEPSDDRRRRGGQRTSGADYFANCTWEATATLTEDTEEVDGIECFVIELELNGEGEMPEPEFGGGRRPRDRALATQPAVAFFENLVEIELEGRLLFSASTRAPLLLEISGTIHQEMQMERSRGDMSMLIESTQDGTLEHTVRVRAKTAQDG